MSGEYSRFVNYCQLLRQFLEKSIEGSKDKDYIKYSHDGSPLILRTGKCKTHGYKTGYIEQLLSSTVKVVEHCDICKHQYLNIEDIIRIIAGKKVPKHGTNGYSWNVMRVHNMCIEIWEKISNLDDKKNLEIETLKKTQIRLKSELVQKDKQINQQLIESINKDQTINSLTNELNGEKQKNTQLADEMRALKKIQIKLKSDSAQKDKQINQLTNEFNDEKQKNTQLETELNNEKQKNKQLENKIQTLENKRPLDNFLNPQQIKETMPNESNDDHGYLYLGRKDKFRIRSEPRYKIGLTQKMNPYDRMKEVTSLGHIYESCGTW